VSLRDAIETALRGDPVPPGVLEQAFGEIADGKASPVAIAALLVALRAKGETVEEIVSAVRALRERALRAPAVDPRTVDTCGTGGDGAGTFNVSTAAGLVAAACGVPVAAYPVTGPLDLVQNGKVFFTTFEPQGDACTPGGKNFLYGLDAITGGAALNQVSIGDPHADAICTSCGAINILEGAPVRDTILTVPTPPTIAGLDCAIGSPGCEPPDPNDPVEKCTLVLQTPGGQPIFLPRACGRQSWRQLE